MLTQEQTNQLIAAGAAEVLLKCGTGLTENSTHLELLVYAQTIIDEAMHNGSHDTVMIMASEERDRLTMQAAGILALALQTYGHKLYTTYELHRSLHATQAPKKSLLLEQQFIRGEAENAYNACLDASLHGTGHDKEAWARLRGAIQNLGAKV